MLFDVVCLIGGLHMFGNKQDFNISLSEYSGEVCLVLYHSPCTLNCNWCFNKNNLTNTLLKYDNAIDIIEDNREFITGVCLTGGEPLLSSDFYDICEYVVDDELKLKINTSGIVKPKKEFVADYVNVSFKGCFGDYARYGYGKTVEELKNSLNIYSNQDFFSKVEWSIVYHPLIIDLHNTFEFMMSLDYRPNYLTLNQLQVGDCIDTFINDFTPPTRETLISELQRFKDLPKEHSLIETKEYGREIIL